MRTLAALTLLLLSAVLWLHHKNGQLAQALSEANALSASQKAAMGALETRLAAALTLGRNNERAQVALRQRLEAAGTQAARREHTITRLLHENASLRRWYDAELPDAVRQLHQRPGYASAGDDLQRLSTGEPVPDAGQQPKD